MRTVTALYLFATALAAPAFAAPLDPLAPRPLLSNSASAVPAQSVPVHSAPDVFGTVAIRAGVTVYDARFRRVAAVPVPSLTPILATLVGLSPDQQIARVKSEVALRVRLTSDLEAMGVADYWDNGADTLARGRGDGEDIAILEMQALKAAGFDPRDLFVSVGRHRLIGTHAVLFARTPAGFVMLDSTERAPVAALAEGAGRFVPVVTVGTMGSFVHGRRIATAR